MEVFYALYINFHSFIHSFKDRSGCGAVAVIIIAAILVPRETAAAVLASWHNVCQCTPRCVKQPLQF